MNIVFVIANLASPNGSTEVPWKSHMEGLGHTVTYKDDNDESWTPTDFDLIAISAQCNSFRCGWLKSASVGLIVFHPSIAVTLEFSTGKAGPYSATQINIVDNSHPITDSFALGNLTVQADSTINFLTGPGPGASVLARHVTTIARKALVAYDTGDEMDGSFSAPARRVFLNLRYLDMVNANGWTLHDETVVWAGPPAGNPYPKEWLKKKVISGFHCFLGAYIKAKILGYDPLKLPDGTIF